MNPYQETTDLRIRPSPPSYVKGRANLTAAPKARGGLIRIDFGEAFWHKVPSRNHLISCFNQGNIHYTLMNVCSPGLPVLHLQGNAQIPLPSHLIRKFGRGGSAVFCCKRKLSEGGICKSCIIYEEGCIPLWSK